MTELHADRYHGGLRIAALASWAVGVAIIYLLGQLIWNLVVGPVVGSGILVLGVAAVFLAQPLALWAEKQLLTLWPSGRAVQLETGKLTLREKSASVRLDLGQKVNYWRWRFEVRNRRGGRVPNGHFCFALRLVQGDTAVSLYAFLSPDQARATVARYPFYDLRPSADKNKATLGGRDAIYLSAERERWDSGAELDPSDFGRLLTHLGAHLPDFSASPNS